MKHRKKEQRERRQKKQQQRERGTNSRAKHAPSTTTGTLLSLSMTDYECAWCPSCWGILYGQQIGPIGRLSRLSRQRRIRRFHDEFSHIIEAGTTTEDPLVKRLTICPEVRCASSKCEVDWASPINKWALRKSFRLNANKSYVYLIVFYTIQQEL